VSQFGTDARVLVLSTPYGDTGFFAELHKRARESEIPDAVAAHATTAEMNPTVDSEILAAEAARDPDSFRSEFLAEFLSPGDAYIDFNRFELGPPDPTPPSDGQGWVLGLDPAFAHDSFGYAVVGRSKATQGLLVVGAVAALPPEEDFTAALSQIATVAEFYKARIVTDQFSSVAICDFLRRRGFSVRQHAMSATSKTLIFQELRARLYDGSLPLPDDPPLVAEARRLRTRFTIGSAAVTNPRVGSSHGDRVQALALAVYEHRRGAMKAWTHNALPAPGGPVLRGPVGRVQGEHYLDEVGTGGQRTPPPGWHVLSNNDGR